MDICALYNARTAPDGNLPGKSCPDLEDIRIVAYMFCAGKLTFSAEYEGRLDLRAAAVLSNSFACLGATDDVVLVKVRVPAYDASFVAVWW